MSLWDPAKPFQELPTLPPTAECETVTILQHCIEARAALAELKQAALLIPNPAILIKTLPMLEARASSEIENIVTTTDKLFEYSRLDSNADPATKEALRYSSALFEAFASRGDHPLNTRTAETICSRIRGVEVKVRSVPGTALKSDPNGSIVYTPPVGETVLRELLANWERYIHSDDPVDPLIKMAVGHYQFEAIHPFTDGNGRTGRILNSLYLIERELLTIPVLYLSRYILQNRNEYNQRLLQVTASGEWESWIKFILIGVEETSRWTTDKIAAIRDLAENTRQHIKRSLPGIYSYELANVIFELPYCRIANLIERGIVQRQTASRYLKSLVEIGVLAEVKAAREKLFVNTRFMELLTQETNSFERF